MEKSTISQAMLKVSELERIYREKCTNDGSLKYNTRIHIRI